jgi:hypothetical protein
MNEDWRLKARELYKQHEDALLNNKLLSFINMKKDCYLYSNDWSSRYSGGLGGYEGDEVERFDELIEFLNIVAPELTMKEYLPIHRMTEIISNQTRNIGDEYGHINFRWRISLEELINYLCYDANPMYYVERS